MEMTKTYSGETVVAIFNSPMPTGEAFGAPIVVGHYGADSAEVFIRQGDATINIQTTDVLELCKHLRAARSGSLEATP